MEISALTVVLLILIGLLIGAVSGMVGIGGGILVIPALMFVFGFTQARANGTSLAMLLPPIGIFAVIEYWRAGNIDWSVAIILAVGFAAGAYVGARAVNLGWINKDALRTCFALLLLYTASRILLPSGGRLRTALEASLLVAGFAITFAFSHLLGRKPKHPPAWGQIYRQRLHEPHEGDYEI